MIWTIAKSAFGVLTGVSPQVWLVLGAIAAFSAYTIGVYQAGRNYQEEIDGAAALRLENARLVAAKEAADKQLREVNTIQQRDAQRALELEGDLAALRKQINEIPESTNPGVSGNVSGRVRRIR